jgi:hypothetical protein
MLGERYRVADYFFSLEDLLRQDRLGEVVALAKDSVVEVETHPVNPDEYSFLMTSPLLSGDSLAQSYMPDDALCLDRICHN